MLPVGILNASITNARKRNASIKAVMSHSKVLAISTALFLRAVLFEAVRCVLSWSINRHPIVKGCSF